jgi:hypothetical protein
VRASPSFRLKSQGLATAPKLPRLGLSQCTSATCDAVVLDTLPWSPFLRSLCASQCAHRMIATTHSIDRDRRAASGQTSNLLSCHRQRDRLPRHCDMSDTGCSFRGCSPCCGLWDHILVPASGTAARNGRRRGRDRDRRTGAAADDPWLPPWAAGRARSSSASSVRPSAHSEAGGSCSITSPPAGAERCRTVRSRSRCIQAGGPGLFRPSNHPVSNCVGKILRNCDTTLWGTGNVKSEPPCTAAIGKS